METLDETLKNEFSTLEQNKDLKGIEQFSKDIEGTGQEELEKYVEAAKTRISQELASKTETIKSLGGSTESLEKEIASTEESIQNVSTGISEKMSGLATIEDHPSLEQKAEKDLTSEEKDRIVSQFADQIYAHNIDAAIGILSSLSEKDRGITEKVIAETLRVNNLRQDGESTNARVLEKLSGVVSPEIMENVKARSLLDAARYSSKNVEAVLGAQKTYGIPQEELAAMLQKGSAAELRDQQEYYDKKIENVKTYFKEKIEETFVDDEKNRLRRQLDDRLQEEQEVHEAAMAKSASENEATIQQLMQQLPTPEAQEQFVEPEVDDFYKKTLEDPKFTEGQVTSLLANYNDIGGLLHNTRRAEYALIKGFVTTDQLALGVQNVITAQIERAKKDGDSKEIMEQDLKDNLEEVKGRFKNPQIFEEILSKVKIPTLG